MRVNANLKTETVEQLQGRKKTMHVTAFRMAIDDLRRSLQATAEDKDGQLARRVGTT